MIDETTKLNADLTNARALLDAAFARERRMFVCLMRMTEVLANAAVAKADEPKAVALKTEVEAIREILGSPVPPPEGLMLEHVKVRARCASVERANEYLRQQNGRLLQVTPGYEMQVIDLRAHTVQVEAERDALLKLMVDNADVAAAAMAEAAKVAEQPKPVPGQYREPPRGELMLQAGIADAVHALWNHGEKERARKLANAFSIDLPSDTVSKPEAKDGD